MGFGIIIKPNILTLNVKKIIKILHQLSPITTSN